MLVKILTISFLFLVSNAFAETIAPKIAHIGVAHNDAIIRHATGNKAIVVSKPGAKGLIAFQALENKEVDFVLIAPSPLFVTPYIEPNIYKYEPLKKFKYIGVLAEMPSGFVLSPKYKSVDDLMNKSGAILHASGGDESNLIMKKRFPGKEIVNVEYKGQGQQVIDVKAGLADIGYFTIPTIERYGEKAHETTRSIKLHLITRHDVSDEQIKELKDLIKSNIDSPRVKEFSESTNTKFLKEIK